MSENIIKFKYNIVAPQQVRWQGKGQIDMPQYSIMCSETDRRIGQYGTGFIITKAIRKCLLEFEHINERLCRMRIKGKFRNITFVTADTLMEETEGGIKDNFIINLKLYVVKYKNMIYYLFWEILMPNEYRGVSEKYTLHEECSEDDTMLCQSAAINNLLIKSTYFPHRKINLGTWK